MSARGTIAICGADGFIGRKACKFFSQRGFRVLGLIRDAGRRGTVTEGGAEPCVVDYHDLTSLTEALATATYVIDLIGTGSQTPDETYEETNVATTRSIVRACEGVAVARFIYFSGLGTREGNTNAYFISRLLAERAIVRSRLDHTIFRPSYIIGRGDLFTSRILKQIRGGVVNVYGSGRYRLQPIYIDDALKISLNALTNEGASRQIIDLVGPRTITFLDYVDMLSKELGVEAKKNFIELEEAIRAIMRGEDMSISFDQLIIRICDEVSDYRPLERIFGIELTQPEEAVSRILAHQPISGRVDMEEGEGQRG